MCFLITIGVRESRASVEGLVADNGVLAVRSSRNSSLRSVFPPADQLLEITRGNCSCDPLRTTDSSLDHQRARLRAQYGLKGWSEVKISRALTEWESAHRRRLEARASPTAELTTLLKGLASRPGGLRVVVHFYSGPFDSEAVRVARRAKVPVERLVDVRDLAEDTLLEVAVGGR